MRLAIPNVPAINARFWPRGSNVKVDEQALLRHLGALDPAIFTFERRRRAEALRCLRKRDINHPGLPDAFLISFLMLLENDRRNFGLLREANLLPVVKQYLRAHLTPTDQDGGWPPLSETISLAVGLLWLMSSPC